MTKWQNKDLPLKTVQIRQNKRQKRDILKLCVKTVSFTILLAIYGYIKTHSSLTMIRLIQR